MSERELNQEAIQKSAAAAAQELFGDKGLDAVMQEVTSRLSELEQMANLGNPRWRRSVGSRTSRSYIA